MFSFAGAKVRRFSATNQISKQETTKTFLFIDINQQSPDKMGGNSRIRSLPLPLPSWGVGFSLFNPFYNFRNINT